mmetsp:Transcript_17834/g.31230  ORF Transcript_17834/g.31230 Transcript_17834/m.31230 type:complete len:90 (-) Transcript_17834:1815-2084(-)
MSPDLREQPGPVQCTTSPGLADSLLVDAEACPKREEMPPLDRRRRLPSSLPGEEQVSCLAPDERLPRRCGVLGALDMNDGLESLDSRDK